MGLHKAFSLREQKKKKKKKKKSVRFGQLEEPHKPG
jgi:hypothetical protein